MIQRCHNQNSGVYSYYGGRGITVCEVWRYNFPAFEEWSINNGYEEWLTIERNDTNGNYEPGNCSWKRRTIQMHNKRSAKNSSSKYKGVFYSNEIERNKRWRSIINKDYETYFIGYFLTEVEAANAYDKKAKELYGDDASLNFPIA